MAHDSSTALIEYLRGAFPGTRVYESTDEAEEWPLMRCFRIKDGRTTYLLVVASKLFATKSDEQLWGLLDESDLPEFLSRAGGAPVLLTENGLDLVG